MANVKIKNFTSISSANATHFNLGLNFVCSSKFTTKMAKDLT